MVGFAAKVFYRMGSPLATCMTGYSVTVFATLVVTSNTQWCVVLINHMSESLLVLGSSCKVLSFILCKG